MKLTLKFNLIFLVVFGLGLAVTGIIAQRSLQKSAHEQVVDQARLIMETSSSTRNYTSQHIRPILEKLSRRNETFHPESVPAFSALTVFSYLHKIYPANSYREATLNPTNPEDRAVDWEADIINAVCHVRSVPEAAPPPMVRIYGPNNGFGWKVGEIVGAQIISVPLSIPIRLANDALLNLMPWLAGVSVLSLILLNITLIAAVNLDVPELPVMGSDEVSVLADSFNRMHRSLVKAIKLLEG